MEQLWNNLPCGELDRAEISSLEDGRSHVASQVGVISPRLSELEIGNRGGGVYGLRLTVEEARVSLSIETDGRLGSEDNVAAPWVACRAPEDVVNEIERNGEGIGVGVPHGRG